MDSCEVSYHREDTEEEERFEMELDSLMRKFGLERRASGMAVGTHMRNIRYNKNIYPSGGE